jgi:hypothetical protein
VARTPPPCGDGNIAVLPHADDHCKAGQEAIGDAVPIGERRGKVSKSDVIRALIDRVGPIETGDDLIEWVNASAGKGLGLAQQKKR